MLASTSPLSREGWGEGPGGARRRIWRRAQKLFSAPLKSRGEPRPPHPPAGTFSPEEKGGSDLEPIYFGSVNVPPAARHSAFVFTTTP
ncbi:hypothetical protein GCM10009429_07680 [Dyella marensis]